jgi:LuxR family maltose regulon positive regulatory protein
VHNSPKISRPHLPRVYQRTRVFARFDELAESAGLWVSGPAGAGKTTAIASFLEAREQVFGWYDLDAGDAEPATLFHYLTLLAAKILGGEVSLPRFSPEYQAGVAVFARRFFDELFGVLPDKAVLVFDNYQDLSPDAPVHDVIREAFSIVVPRVRVFVASRSEPPPQLARALANRRIAQVGWNTLRFTEPETSALISSRTASRVSEPLVADVHRLADGWVAGIILLLETRDTSLAEPIGFDGPSIDRTFEYFASEVLDCISPATVHLLLVTACMPHVTAEAAEAVTGQPGAGAVLAHLQRQNLFTVRRNSSPAAYTYHPLFRAFLLRQADQRLPAAELREARRRAAQALAESGDAREAMELLRRDGQWRDAISLVLVHAPRLLAAGQVSTLNGWLAWLPGEAFAGDPWLMFWKASATFVFQPGASVALWRVAIDRFREAADPTGLRLSLAGILRAIVAEERDLRQLDPVLDELARVEQAQAVSPSPSVEAKLASAALLACVHRGDVDVFQRWEHRVADAFRTTRIDSDRMLLGGSLAWCRTFVGHFAGAEEMLSSLRSLTADTGDPLVRLPVLLAECFLLAHGRRPIVSCDAPAEEGLRLSDESGVLVYRDYFVCLGVTNAIFTGDRARAEEYLAHAEDRNWTNQGAGFHAWTRACFSIEFENGRTALWWAERALALSISIDYPEGTGLALSAIAAFHIEYGSPADAAPHLARAEALLGARMTSPRMKLGVLLLRGYWLLQSGQLDRALEHVREAFGFARRIDLPAGGWIPRRAMAHLCGWALEQGIEPDCVRTVIERRRLSPASGSRASPAWPWQLRVVALSQLRVVIDGQTQEWRGKQPKMPLRLLQAILAAGGEPAPLTEISEWLWPGADGDMGRRALDTTVHRLRRLLVHEEVLVTTENGLRFDPTRVYVDAFAVEPLAVEIAGLIEAGARPGSPALAAVVSSLLDQYRGPFLVGEDTAPGIRRFRDRLRRAYVKAVVRVGELLEQARRPEEALALYQRGLAAEDAVEQFYQRALACHAALGQRFEAHRLWATCREVLEDRLGTAPSEHTRRAYERAS